MLLCGCCDVLGGCSCVAREFRVFNVLLCGCHGVLGGR